MKKITYILIGLVIGGFLTVQAAFPPSNVSQGGTGTTTIPTGQLIYGDTALRIGATSTLTFSTSTKTLKLHSNSLQMNDAVGSVIPGILWTDAGGGFAASYNGSDIEFGNARINMLPDDNAIILQPSEQGVVGIGIPENSLANGELQVHHLDEFFAYDAEATLGQFADPIDGEATNGSTALHTHLQYLGGSKAETYLSSYSDSLGKVYGVASIDSNALNFFEGNVGIGTSSPTSNLDIYASSPLITLTDSGNKTRSIIKNLGGTETDFCHYDELGRVSGCYNMNNDGETEIASNDWSTTLAGNPTGPSARDVLYTNNTERVRVDNVGNVGIGTNSPSSILDVVNGDDGPEEIAQFRASNKTQGIGISYGGIRKLTTNNNGTIGIAAADSTAGSGAAGGDVIFSAGIGGSDSGEGSTGNGGGVTATGAKGGAAASSATGGTGGGITLTAGNGGNGSGDFQAGDGGSVTITSGSAGTDGGGGSGSSGNINLTPAVGGAVNIANSAGPVLMNFNYTGSETDPSTAYVGMNMSTASGVKGGFVTTGTNYPTTGVFVANGTYFQGFDNTAPLGFVARGTGNPITFTTGGYTAEKMRITSAGNVGIGTTSPYATLSVVGQTVASYFTATTSTSSQFPYASSTALTLTGSLFAGANLPGNSGDVLTSTGSAISWKSPATALNATSTAILLGKTASIASVNTYTPTASSTFAIYATTDVTAEAVQTLTVSVTYTDTGGASRTQNFFGMGLTTAAIGSTGDSNFPPMIIRPMKNTAITVSTTVGGVGSITYNIDASIVPVSTQ